MTTTAAWPDQGFPVYWLNGTPVITTPPEIDAANQGALVMALLGAATSNRDVIVDMSGTTFCGCGVLTILLQARDGARARGGEIRLVIAAPSVLVVFAVTGLDTAFPVYATVAEAFAAK